MRCRSPLLLFICIILTVSLFSGLGIAETVDAWFAKEDYLNDYDFLWQTLEECYPYWGVLERAGIDIDQVRTSNWQKLDERLDANGGFRAFYTSVELVCAALNNFAHLGPVSPDSYFNQCELYKSDEASYHAWLDILNEERTSALYHQLARPRETHAGGEQRYTSAITKLYPRQRVGYLSIKSFYALAIENDGQLIANFLEKTKDYNHIMIDITGNGGGSSFYWTENIVFPLGGAYEYEQYMFFTKGAAEQLPILLPGQAISPISELPSDVIFAYPEDMASLNFFKMLIWRIDVEEPQIQHRAKRWLLVDGNVYSAAEQFALFCKETGWATLVGHATKGDGITGVMPSLVALPNTGLLVRFNAAYGLNSDGSCNAEVGTVPDIYCKRGESPITTCLRLIESEGVPTDEIKKDPFMVRRK